LNMQRHEAEQRVSDTEEKSEESQGRFEQMSTCPRNACSSDDAMCSASSLTMRDARRVESDRVRNQRRQDDQKHRQQSESQLVCDTIRKESEKECAKTLQDASGIQALAKSHARAQQIAVAQENAQALQLARACVADESQKHTEAAAEFARQRLHDAERLEPRVLDAAEGGRSLAERVAAEEQCSSERFVVEARLAAEQRQLLEKRNATMQAREEVLVALVDTLKQQCIQAEQRAQKAEEKALHVCESQQVSTCSDTSARNNKDATRCASSLTLRDARRVESDRARKQRRKDDQKRRRERESRLAYDTQRKEVEKECAKARQDVAEMRALAKSHARAQKLAVARESAKILQHARDEANRLVVPYAEARCLAEQPMAEEQHLRAVAELVLEKPTGEGREEVVAVVDVQQCQDPEGFLQGLEVEDAAEWQILSDPEVEDTWDLIV